MLTYIGKQKKYGGWGPVFAMLALVAYAAIQVFHPAIEAASVGLSGLIQTHAVGIGAGAVMFGTVFPIEFKQFWHSIDQVWYTCSNATVVNTPIWVAGFGALVPMVSSDAATAAPYRRFGVFSGTIVNGVTIAQGDPVFYISASGCVTNVDPTSSGFLLGMAAEAGTAAGTATVYTTLNVGTVAIVLNAYAMPTATAVSCTSLTASGNAAVSGNETIGGTLTVSGLTTAAASLAVTGTVAATSTVTATKFNAIAGRVTDKKTVTAINTTGAVSAAAIVGGLISSNAVSTGTLDSAANIYALIPGATTGTTVTFSVLNTASAGSFTVAVPASITNRSGVAGDLVVLAATRATLTIIFTSPTAADLWLS